MDLRKSEMTFILRPTLEQPEAERAADAIAEQIKALGGEVEGIDHHGKRRLAYEIEGVRDGYYVTINYALARDQAKELDRQVGLNELVMRHLVMSRES